MIKQTRDKRYVYLLEGVVLPGGVAGGGTLEGGVEAGTLFG